MKTCIPCMKRTALGVLYTLSILLLTVSCASTSPAEGPGADDTASAAEGTEMQKSLTDSALWALGRRKLEVKGRRFNLDCSGVVMAVYYRSGLDLQPLMAPYAGGGVARLYALMEDKDLLYRPTVPAPGDLLFWDNSYDKNGNGRRDDEFTHVGMVVRSRRDGTVEYIHHNYRKGIVLARMNLTDPDNLELNSPMRARNAEAGHAPKWLSSHLLRRAARGYELVP